MDRQKAIDRFREQADRFSQLALVTDHEIRELFGKEVAAAITYLDDFGRGQSLCSRCRGTCCADIACELYSPKLGSCPIYDFRPMVCRFHFCHSFDAAGKSQIIELRDIFLGCLETVRNRPNAKRMSIDIPPFGEACAELITASRHLLAAAGQDRIDARHAAEQILEEARRFRFPGS